MSQTTYLEDIAVGRRLAAGPVTLTPENIKGFAAEFDPQDFHLDEAAGETSFFKGFAASGWHTAALTMRMMVSTGLQPAWGYIGGGAEIRWPQPAYAGDVLSLRGEVLEVTPSRSKPDRGFVKVRFETVNQRGEVVQELTVRVLVPRRPVSFRG